MENIRFLNSYRNIPHFLLMKCQDGYEIPDLWNSFKTGLIVAGVNHAAHLVHQTLRTVEIEVTDENTGSTKIRELDGYLHDTPLYKTIVSGNDDVGLYKNLNLKLSGLALKMVKFPILKVEYIK